MTWSIISDNSYSSSSSTIFLQQRSSKLVQSCQAIIIVADGQAFEALLLNSLKLSHETSEDVKKKEESGFAVTKPIFVTHSPLQKDADKFLMVKLFCVYSKCCYTTILPQHSLPTQR